MVNEILEEFNQERIVVRGRRVGGVLCLLCMELKLLEEFHQRHLPLVCRR
jgi:cephalosporin-C deacetylase-like acetyl esterase